jgi:hypothetical protein
LAVDRRHRASPRRRSCGRRCKTSSAFPFAGAKSNRAIRTRMR